MRDIPMVNLPSKRCVMCGGRGWYAYPGIGRTYCECAARMIEHEAWKRAGRPRTVEDLETANYRMEAMA